MSLGAIEVQRLGTNAVDVIPELKVLLRSTNPLAVSLTAHTLAEIGVESVPVLRDAFADTNQLRRTAILLGLRWIAFGGHTNECMPIIISALQDPDAKVRSHAGYLLQVTSTDELHYIGW